MEKGNKTTVMKFSTVKKITKIVLGSVHVPDANKKNNAWQSK